MTDPVRDLAEGPAGEPHVEVSVVIPCYNAAQTLGEQLVALSRQVTPAAWEVIVSDNGSTDDSREVAERHRALLPRLRVVDASGRRGASHAYNVGAQAARGMLVLFCDADDVVAGGWLEAMRTALTTADLAGGRLDGERLNTGWRGTARTVPQLTGPQQGPLGLPYFGSGNLGVRREVFLAVGGFDGSLPIFGDTDLCWRVQEAGYTMAFVPGALVHVRLRGTLTANFRQAVDYGVAEEHLAALHAVLRSPSQWDHALRVCVLTWGAMLVRLGRVRRRSELGSWWWQLGWRIGRCRGWWRFRQLPTRAPRSLLAAGPLDLTAR